MCSTLHTLQRFITVSIVSDAAVFAYDAMRPVASSFTLRVCCRELTTLWVARLDDSAELKVTDPKEQQRDVKEEEAEDKERQE